MANPLDIVTEDQRVTPGENPLRRVYIYGDDQRPDAEQEVPYQPQGNQLTQAIAPAPEMNVLDMIAKVKEYLTNPEGFSSGTKIGNRLVGAGGEERFQTWPERMIKSGVTLPGDVATGKVPMYIIDDKTGEVKFNPEVIERSMDTAGLMVPGALTQKAGTATLGTGPVRPGMAKDYLIPAIKYEDKIYKGNKGQEHMDFLPEGFIRKLEKEGIDVNDMDAVVSVIDDTPKFKTGFVDSRGRFLNHEQAGEYAANREGIAHPDHLDYLRDGGFLTSDMLLSDTSKPGAAIAAVANSGMYRIQKAPAGDLQVYGSPNPGKEYAKVLDEAGKVVFEKQGPGSWAEAQTFHRQNSKPSWDVVTGDTTGYYDPVISFPSKKAAEDWIMANGNKSLAPGGATLMSDTGTPGTGIAALAQTSKPAPVFYSALEHAATNAAQETMSPQQWLGFLKNQPGVKAEELAWTGIGDWLGAQKGKISKKDVQGYLDEHKVEIKDVTKGQIEHGKALLDEYVNDAMRDFIDEFHEEHGRVPTDTEYNAQLQVNREMVEQNYSDWIEADSTKYSSYQLPGGENYREHLLTMPNKSTAKISFDDYLKQTSPAAKEDLTPAGLEIMRKRYEKDGQNVVNPDIYKSSHWDEPNVLAHVRTNDRMMLPEKPEISLFERSVEHHKNTGASPEMAERFAREEGLQPTGAKKSLHIEEIQSDWHQQGRKQGYKNQIADKDRPVAIDKLHAIEAQMNEMVKQQKHVVHDVSGVKAAPEYTALQEQKQELMRRIKGEDVPDAPFKTSWPELALKRMIRQAAEEGYDRISWTPGEAQAARYDLSKTLDTLKWDSADGQYGIVGMKNGQGVVTHSKVPGEKLADYVGKEAADKILNGSKKGELSNLDLRVGGEGMREFYDKMLPKMVDKIGKAHGVKVKQTPIEYHGGEKWRIERRDGKDVVVDENGKIVDKPQMMVHYFDIPQSLKDHAIGRGFPLYMSGIPFPLTPVDHDPFKKDK